MEEHDLGRITVEAQKVGLTVSAWVRLQLKKVLNEYPQTDIQHKVSVLREATRHAYPAPDIDEMNAEIESGYKTGMPD